MMVMIVPQFLFSRRKTKKKKEEVNSDIKSMKEKTIVPGKFISYGAIHYDELMNPGSIVMKRDPGNHDSLCSVGTLWINSEKERVWILLSIIDEKAQWRQLLIKDNE